MGKVLNFKQKKQENRIALKVKDTFAVVQEKGSSLEPEEYRDYIMLLLADLMVYVIKSGWYSNPGKALKNGVDALVKRFG